MCRCQSRDVHHPSKFWTVTWSQTECSGPWEPTRILRSSPSMTTAGSSLQAVLARQCPGERPHSCWVPQMVPVYAVHLRVTCGCGTHSIPTHLSCPWVVAAVLEMQLSEPPAWVEVPVRHAAYLALSSGAGDLSMHVGQLGSFGKAGPVEHSFSAQSFPVSRAWLYFQSAPV